MRCKSSTHGVYNGCYNRANISKQLRLRLLKYLCVICSSKITALTRVFSTVKLTDSIRLVGMYHG